MQVQPRRLYPFICVVLALILLLSGCAVPREAVPARSGDQDVVFETNAVEVVDLPLEGIIAIPEAEISGLAWYRETLILLPQYPSRFAGPGFGTLFGIDAATLEDAINGQGEVSIEPFEIRFDSGGLETTISGFEGYEAIAFEGDTAYLTIEARPGKMRAYLVEARLNPDSWSITLDPGSLLELPLPVNISNSSYETLVVFQERVFAIFEANGAALNASPYAIPIIKGEPAAHVPFPNIEFRITDATQPDANGTFWAVNYFFPGDTHLAPALDPTGERYPAPDSPPGLEQVERLLQFKVEDRDIVLSQTAPIYMTLADESRNWEGIAFWNDHGFLLATDKFPDTQLGYLPIR